MKIYIPIAALMILVMGCASLPLDNHQLALCRAFKEKNGYFRLPEANALSPLLPVVFNDPAPPYRFTSRDIESLLGPPTSTYMDKGRRTYEYNLLPINGHALLHSARLLIIFKDDVVCGSAVAKEI
jgi:hypothetical protein